MGKPSKFKRSSKLNVSQARKTQQEASDAETWKRRFAVKEEMFVRIRKELRETKKKLEATVEEIRITVAEKTSIQVQINDGKTEINAVKEEIQLITVELDAEKRRRLLSDVKIAETSSTPRRVVARDSGNSLRYSNFVTQPETTPTSCKTGPISEAKTPEIFKKGSFQRTMSVYKKKQVTGGIVHIMKNVCVDVEDYPVLCKGVLATFSSECANFRLSLSLEDTLLLRSIINLSDNALKTLKSFLKDRLGYDVLGSRLAVNQLRRELSVAPNYHVSVEQKSSTSSDGKTTMWKAATATIVDLEKALCNRLSCLSDNGRLVYDSFTKDDIVLCLMGDKGKNETKIAIAIANQTHPNSVHSLLTVGVYEGNDSYDELMVKMAPVFRQFDSLESIVYTTNGIPQPRRKIRKLFTGDFKFISAVFGHCGATAAHPCSLCTEPWANKGKNKLVLSKVDFAKNVNIRTYDSYINDAKTGSNGVYLDRQPLIHMEPEDVIVPTVHLVLGLWVKFGEEYIVGALNDIDRKDGMKGSTLREQKKDLEMLTNEEQTMIAAISVLRSAAEEAMCVATVYDIIQKNPVMHLKRPTRLCDQTTCISNHMKKNTDTWIQCDNCKRDFHMYCTSLFCPEEKAKLSLPGVPFLCVVCKGESLETLKNDAFRQMTELEKRVAESEERLKDLRTKRDNLEGIVKKSMGPKKREYERILSAIGCNTQTWYHSPTGNQVRKILRKTHIDMIMDLLPDTPKNQHARQAYYHLADLMSTSSNTLFTDSDLTSIAATIDSFLRSLTLAFPNESITPKLHALAYHLLPYLQRNRSWGKLCEQVMEHLHSKFNNLMAQFSPVKNVDDRMRLVLQELGLRNFLSDKGLLSDND